MSAEKYRQQLDLVKKARSEDWKKSVEQYSATKRFDMLSIGVPCNTSLFQFVLHLNIWSIFHGLHRGMYTFNS